MSGAALCGIPAVRRRRRRTKPSAGRRFFDAASAAWMVKVFPGEFYVTKKTDEVLVTVLGSCVSACIRDPFAGIGGMNHFMLPHTIGRLGRRSEIDALRQFRHGEAHQRADQGRMLARAHGNQGFRRRQCHRHQQRDRHRQRRIRSALSEGRGSAVRRAGSRRHACRGAFTIIRRPAASCAGCSAAASAMSSTAKRRDYGKRLPAEQPAGEIELFGEGE